MWLTDDKKDSCRELFIQTVRNCESSSDSSSGSAQTDLAVEDEFWSDSGWTKQGIALLWFTNSFLPAIGKESPQVLILDGHESHNFLALIDVAVANNIHIIELPAHTSNWLQPCDRTVFGPFKTAYRNACDELMNSFPGAVVSRSTFCGIFNKAWSEAVTVTNVQTKFWPSPARMLRPDYGHSGQNMVPLSHFLKFFNVLTHLSMTTPRFLTNCITMQVFLYGQIYGSNKLSICKHYCCQITIMLLTQLCSNHSNLLCLN